MQARPQVGLAFLPFRFSYAHDVSLSLVWVGTLAGCPYPSGFPFPLTRGYPLGFTRSVLVVASHLPL